MVEENVLQTEVATKQHGIRDATMIHKTGDAIRTTKNSDTITITKNSNRIMIKRKRGVVNGGEDYVRDDGDCGHNNAYFLFGHLGRKRRVRLPECVVDGVRALWPNPMDPKLQKKGKKATTKDLYMGH